MAAIWLMQKRKSTISRKMRKWWILLYLYLNVYSTVNLDFYSKLSLCFGRLARFILILLPFAYFERKPCQDEADCMPAMWDKSCMKPLKN